MFRSLLVLATLVFFVREAKAQTVDSLRRYPHNTHHREITLLIGYDQGRYGYAEVGLGANIFGSAHHPYAMAAFIGSEVRVDRTTLIGPKAGIWLAGGVAMGAQAIYYTDGHERSFVLRPEYGFGFHKFKVTYGYNFRITNKDLQGINSHLLNLTYCFRLARLKGDDDRLR